MSDSEPIVEPGMVLAERYEVTEEIGRGGFGRIYRARQINVDRDVAVKVLPPKFISTHGVVERFRREARLASRLRHPNTITVHDYGKQDDLLFIVMELLEGEDLADVLRRRRTLPLAMILHVGRQVLKSLQEAHSHQIVHRDLKPENVFLTRVGSERDFVKVLDFGIAKLAMPEMDAEAELDEEDEEFKKLTIMGSTVGTPTYMSPEQAAGEEVDGRTDIYALGIILFEMACGRPPFVGDNPVKLMRKHLFEDIPRMPDDELRGTTFEAVVRRALAKDKEERFESARAFEEALQMSAGRMMQPADDVDLSGLSAETTEEPSTYDSDNIAFQRTAHYEVDNSDASTPRRNTGSLRSSDVSDEPVPFETVPDAEERERVAESAASSSLTDISDVTSRSDLRDGPPTDRVPPDGSEPTGLSNSSIVTVLEPSPTDEVILLTNAKKGSPKPPDDESAGDASKRPGAEAPAAAERDPAPSEDAPPAEASTESDWEWGVEKSTAQTSDTELDYGAGTSRRWWPVMLVVALVAAALAVGYFGGWLTLP